MTTRAKRPAEHVAKIENPIRWRYWPALQVRRDRPDHESELPWTCGIVFDVPGFRQTVFEIALFLLNGRTFASIANDPSIVRHEYTDAAAMVADGWTVD